MSQGRSDSHLVVYNGIGSVAQSVAANTNSDRALLAGGRCLNEVRFLGHATHWKYLWHIEDDRCQHYSQQKASEFLDGFSFYF
jgi:hypothetical protein